MLARSAFLSGIFATIPSALALSLAASAGGARSGDYCLPLVKGTTDQIFDFSLPILDSTDIFSLSDYLGHAVWINFFASWCGPCNVEAPDIARMAQKYEPQGLRVFGIDVKEGPEKARAFRDRAALTYPILLDAKGSVYDVFSKHAIPVHVFFGPNGRITCISQGDLTPTEMDNEIAVALAMTATPKP